MTLDYYLLEDAADSLGVSTRYLLHKGALNELPLYIFSRDMLWNLSDYCEKLFFVRFKYRGFLKLHPATIQDVECAGTSQLINCYIEGKNKKELFYLSDFKDNYHGKIPSDLLDEILSESDLKVFPTGQPYVGRIDAHTNELDIFAFESDLQMLGQQSTLETKAEKQKSLNGKTGLDPRERSTYESLIKVLALEAGLDLSHPYAAAETILLMAEKHSVKVPKKADTIAKKLTEARNNSDS